MSPHGARWRLVAALLVLLAVSPALAAADDRGQLVVSSAPLVAAPTAARSLAAGDPCPAGEVGTGVIWQAQRRTGGSGSAGLFEALPALVRANRELTVRALVPVSFGPPAMPAWVTTTPADVSVDGSIVPAYTDRGPDGDAFPVVFTARLAPGQHRLTVAWEQRAADPPLRESACRASASIDITAGSGTPLPLRALVEGAPELTRDFGPRPAGVTRVAIWAGRPPVDASNKLESVDDLTVDCRSAAAGPFTVTVASGRRRSWMRVPKMCVPSYTQQTVALSSCPSSVACDYRVRLDAWGEGALLSVGPRTRELMGRRATYTVTIEEGRVSTRRFRLDVRWPRTGAPIVTGLRELTVAPRVAAARATPAPAVHRARAVTLPTCSNGEAPSSVRWLTLVDNGSNDVDPLPDVVTAGRPMRILFAVGTSPNGDFTHDFREQSVFVDGRPIGGQTMVPVAGTMTLRAVWVARGDGRHAPEAQACAASVERTLTAVEGAPLAFTPAVSQPEASADVVDAITFTAPAGSCRGVVGRPFVGVLRALGTEVRAWRRFPCSWEQLNLLHIETAADARPLTDIPGLATLHLGERELEVELQPRPPGVGRGRIQMELEILQGDTVQRWAWTSIATKTRSGMRVRAIDLRSVS